MKTTTTFDYPALPAGSTFNIRLMITLLGDVIASDNRTPLNIAMVIDNSSSMQGDKIAKVKEAASMIVRMLSSQDIFSLVTFNDKVSTIVPVAKGRDLAGVDTLIDEITTKGCTNLSGGYERGFELASEARNIATTRIVLLSDGQANRGTTSSIELSAIARKFRDHKITTSTIGAGLDFDETLMAEMAEAGGGSANYMEHPWQAAEVFGEELEDLRNITATNTRVRFAPGGSVVSFTLLNNFPDDGKGFWLIGDVYGTKERRVVVEIEIKTDIETADLSIGSFEVMYDLPGKGTTVPTQFPVSMPVVSSQVFATHNVDNEVTLEAALLSIGRAKRDALRLSRDQKFIDAADLLDRFITALSELQLNDLELERELQQLKERSWQLRHRGKEFFTAAEQKHIAYEADMTMKGKKDMYRAMMMRREPARSESSNNSISVYSLIDNRDFMVDGSPTRTVSDFLKDVFIKFDGAVKPHTYGVEWALRDSVTSRIFDVGSSYAKAHGVREDRRVLNDISIHSGIKMEAIPLSQFGRDVKHNQAIPPDVIRIDLRIDSAKRYTKDIRIRPSSITCDFLATVYEEIKNVVPPNSYGRTWILRDTATGRVFDAGSGWAKFHQLQADVRPLDKVGIKGGSMLQVVII